MKVYILSFSKRSGMVVFSTIEKAVEQLEFHGFVVSEEHTKAVESGEIVTIEGINFFSKEVR